MPAAPSTAAMASCVGYAEHRTTSSGGRGPSRPDEEPVGGRTAPGPTPAGVLVGQHGQRWYTSNAWLSPRRARRNACSSSKTMPRPVPGSRSWSAPGALRPRPPPTAKKRSSSSPSSVPPSSSPTWCMPRMDGLQLLKALKDEADQLKIIMLTAQGSVETRRRSAQGRRGGLPDQAGRSAEAAAAAEAHRRAERAEARERSAAAAAAREGQLRPHRRQQPEDAADLPGDRAGGADAGLGAHHRRVGHRQGARRADDPSVEPARRGAVCRHQLRRDSGDAARERDLRPRARRVHRRDRAARRLLRARRPRHAVPRRDRRDGAR